MQYHDSCNAQVHGDTMICDNAIITKNSDYLFIDRLGSRNGSTTFFKTKDNNIGVKCGCFNGTLNEFREKVRKTHGYNKFAKEYLILSDLAELRLSNKEVETKNVIHDIIQAFKNRKKKYK